MNTPILLAAATLVVGVVVWVSFGMPSPNTLAHIPTGQQECVAFASKNASEIGWETMAIKAHDWWIKNGRVVVLLGASDPDKSAYASFATRICVLSDN